LGGKGGLKSFLELDENSYIFKKPLPVFGIDTPVGEITEGLYRV
jgi:hypothetical protein